MGSLPTEKTPPTGGPGIECRSFLQHTLGIISCHLHSRLWSEVYDLLFQMEPPQQLGEGKAWAEADTQFTRACLLQSLLFDLVPV